MTRFLRFSAVGAVGFAVQLSLLAALVAAGLHYALATVLAIEAAIVVNYFWHEHWTWGDRTGAQGPPSRPEAASAESRRSSPGNPRAKADASRFIKFNAMTAATSIAGGALLTVGFVELLALPPVAANVASVALLSVINFIGADRLVFRAGVAAMVVAAASVAHAEEAKLQPKTLAGFQKYAAAVEARRARELAANAPFMAIERRSSADRARIMALLRRGEIYVEQGARARDDASNEVEIDGGLINHWRGTIFIPNVTLDRVLQVLQSPDTGGHQQEDVLWSRIVPNADGSQKLIARVKRTKFVTVVYDTEYDVRYARLGGDRAASDSRSTKIVEIEHAGTPRERALPEGDDHGYLWRLNSYWRYTEAGGGVLVEVESLTLSRDLPPLVGPLVRPIVNSTARESIARTLTSLRGRFKLIMDP